MKNKKRKNTNSPSDMGSVRRSLNGNVIKRYKEIPNYKLCKSRVMMPGVYCKNCGETFALYAWSAAKPDGSDENNKFFYNKCLNCA